MRHDSYILESTVCKILFSVALQNQVGDRIANYFLLSLFLPASVCIRAHCIFKTCCAPTHFINCKVRNVPCDWHHIRAIWLYVLLFAWWIFSHAFQLTTEQHWRLSGLSKYSSDNHVWRYVFSWWVLCGTKVFITKICLFKYTENFTTKKWKFSDKKFWYFVYFALNICRLWVLVRTASPRWF